MISKPGQTDKAIFVIDQQGTCYIAKCWGPRHERASNTECTVYEGLSELRPGGYDVFVNMILAGNILCSNLSPGERTIALPYKVGQVLTRIWNDLNDRERTHVREECEKAIHIFRSLSIRVPDIGKHNVPYERNTAAVTILDFKTAMECPQSEHVPYVELLLLFGDPVMRGRTSGG
ncbi:hypothetical protein N7520_005816 [Penicillium odoratum]|uniref:uncharacterized protein n=1 Tax=Penicillium odoratum TaxID=1167516 RepID=UPI0025468FB1|nr:uncharacterized protein N7520_005816 [Penicillium odoratum]KAJ5758660.1 hypothetical protein N7520_005816 [Penicillium odoratum]